MLEVVTGSPPPPPLDELPPPPQAVNAIAASTMPQPIIGIFNLSKIKPIRPPETMQLIGDSCKVVGSNVSRLTQMAGKRMATRDKFSELSHWGHGAIQQRLVAPAVFFIQVV
jgi:hypothetical protein